MPNNTVNTTMNTTKFASLYLGATVALMDAIANVGTTRNRSWTHAHDLVMKAIEAAHDIEEINIGMSLFNTIKKTESS